MASLGLLNAYGSESEEEAEEEKFSHATGGSASPRAATAGVTDEVERQTKEGKEKRKETKGTDQVREERETGCEEEETPRRSGGDGGGGGAEDVGDHHSCDPAVQAKVAKFLELKQIKGRDLLEDIRSRKSFRNPDFLQKMVEHFGIEQYGSCYPRHIYDYEDLHASDMYDKLEQQLEQLEERKQVEKLRQQEDEQRRAIVFQRQGFQRGVMSQHQQQTKRRRYFHE